MKIRPDTAKIITIISKRIMSVFLYLSCVNLVAIPQLEGQHILRGQVVKEDSPVTDGYVMLHSVSSMRSGQVDSVSLSSEGYFEFQLQGFDDIGGSDEVYFASVEHQGVLYFGSAAMADDPATDVAPDADPLRFEQHFQRRRQLSRLRIAG